MNVLQIQSQAITLVDQVEDQLLSYLKTNNYKVGDSIPNEMELTAALGVARSVLREALSRLKMLGMIECRPRRGMILREPSLLGSMHRIIDPRILSESTLYDIIGLRIALEVGMADMLLDNITDKDLSELEEIVQMEEALENNEYTLASELNFHVKLYSITGNKTMMEFQQIIHPIMQFIKDKFKEELRPINIRLKEENKMISHVDLLNYLKLKDRNGYKRAIEQHFEVYRIIMKDRK